MKLPTPPIRTAPMKRVQVPRRPKSPAPLPKSTQNEQAIEALTDRVYELETRLARLEAAIDVQDLDVVISATGSVLIQGASSVEMSGAILQMSGAVVEANTSIFKATGVVQCGTLIADSVVGASYTPGAGNLY